jgi:hypothetical protein
VILIAGHRFKPHHEGKLSPMDAQTRTLLKDAMATHTETRVPQTVR